MGSKFEAKKNARGDWVITDADGDSIEIEWARSTGSAGDILLRIKPNAMAGMVWIPKDQLEEFIDMLRDASQPPCMSCGGSGKR